MLATGSANTERSLLPRYADATPDLSFMPESRKFAMIFRPADFGVCPMMFATHLAHALFLIPARLSLFSRWSSLARGPIVPQSSGFHPHLHSIRLFNSLSSSAYGVLSTRRIMQYRTFTSRVFPRTSLETLPPYDSTESGRLEPFVFFYTHYYRTLLSRSAAPRSPPSFKKPPHLSSPVSPDGTALASTGLLSHA